MRLHLRGQKMHLGYRPLVLAVHPLALCRNQPITRLLYQQKIHVAFLSKLLPPSCSVQYMCGKKRTEGRLQKILKDFTYECMDVYMYICICACVFPIIQIRWIWILEICIHLGMGMDGHRPSLIGRQVLSFVQPTADRRQRPSA